MPSTRHRSDAFTLTELLVCVMIIAILSALALPAYQAVRLSGLVSKNLTNLRTLQFANIAYANDHDGCYVPVASWNQTGVGTFWQDNQEFRRSYLFIPATGAWPDKMISPLATMRDGNGNRLMYRSYGYNITTLGGVFGTAGLSRAATVLQVMHPSETLAFADALDWQISIYGANYYAGREETLQNGVAYRYDGAAGVVYFDGHAAMLRREDAVNNQLLWNIKAQ